MDEPQRRFRDFPLFRHLDDDQVDGLLANGEEVRLPAGEVFIEKGDEGDRLFFVDEGEMEVFLPDPDDGDHKLAVLEAPAVVGELELLTGEPRDASVRALTPLHAVAMGYERLFHQLQDGDPASLRVFFHITQVLARRLSAMNAKFAELERQAPAEGRRFQELRDFHQNLMTEWSV